MAITGYRTIPDIPASTHTRPIEAVERCLDSLFVSWGRGHKQRILSRRCQDLNQSSSVDKKRFDPSTSAGGKQSTRVRLASLETLNA